MPRIIPLKIQKYMYWAFRTCEKKMCLQTENDNTPIIQQQFLLWLYKRADKKV